MSRLYLRIFFSFWLVIVLTIGAVLGINSQLERALRDDSVARDRAARMEASLTRAAESALSEAGRAGLREWAERPRRRRRRIRLYIFDQSGAEIRQQAPDRGTRRIARHWERNSALPPELPRRHFALPVSHPRHGRYLIVHRLPPRSILLSILGPLGVWGLIALAVVFSGGVCFWLARSITAPVRQMRLAGQALGQGEFDTRIPEATARRGDELGDLARGFNHMAARLEKLVAAQQQLLRDMSHELRSPLARLQAALTLAADSKDGVDRDRHLARTEVEVERLNHLIGEILGYARLTEGAPSRFETLDLTDLIEDIAASARLEGAPRNLQVTVEAPASLTASADEELLHRAVENVVRNALRHAPDGSTVTLALSGDDNTATVLVSDRGPGVPEDRLEDIFRPFVRLSAERGEAGPGGGIGLAIARAAVEHHGGNIRAENRDGGGLAVRITLPRHTS